MYFYLSSPSTLCNITYFGVASTKGLHVTKVQVNEYERNRIVEFSTPAVMQGWFPTPAVMQGWHVFLISTYVLCAPMCERFASHKGTANLMNMREAASFRVKPKLLEHDKLTFN